MDELPPPPPPPVAADPSEPSSLDLTDEGPSAPDDSPDFGSIHEIIDCDAIIGNNNVIINHYTEHLLWNPLDMWHTNYRTPFAVFSSRKTSAYSYRQGVRTTV